MSTRVRVSTYLIASKNLLPFSELTSLFSTVLKKHECTLSSGILHFKNEAIGRISFNDRILLETENPINQQLVFLIDEIRKDIAFQAQVIQENIILANQQKIQSEARSLQILSKLSEELEIEKSKMQKSLQVQQMNALDAIHQELVDAAHNNGFIVEESTNSNNQIVLQFVRRI